MKTPLLIGNRLRGFNLVGPYHCFNRTTRTRGYFIPNIHSPKPDISETRKRFGFLFLRSCVSLSPLVLTPSPEHQNFVGAQDMHVIFELLRWTGKRSPAATNGLEAPLFQSRWCHQYPLLHYLWQQIRADLLPSASTPALERYRSSRAYCVWVVEDANSLQRACNLATLDLSKC